MNRRQFLITTGLFSASSLVALGSHGWISRTPAAKVNPKRLIVIFLRGGVDGLNVVVPYREPAYYQARPKISIPQPGEKGGVLDLDGQFGLHPALAPLMPLWQQRSLAFIHNCGSPDPTRSHFEAQHYMEIGIPGATTTQDGWMNRLLAVMSERNPIQAVNIGGTTPQILSGSIPVASLGKGRNPMRRLPTDRPKVGAAFDRLYSGNDPLSQAYREGKIARAELMKNLAAEMEMANNGAPLPKGFSLDTQRLGRLMARDPKIQMAFFALGGWDTHVNQGATKGNLARKLQHLGNGLVALQKGLGSVYKQTTILVISEFGRTVRENGNRGTDHGHGNVMWVLGGAIRGSQVYGKWSGLEKSQLYQGRDLAVTTDFRDAIASVLDKQMGLTQQQIGTVFPKYTPQQKIPLV
ncbi:MAG: DUF1501 domain-containing protein [Calothrix sp. MO_192.B10]|nr:DUF1501 domain-containing protein [Calothrix sp. MO_192.B10]